MGNKLYVANLVFHATEADLEDHFSKVGAVREVKLILDKMTGKSRGFAFITMGSDDDAERAISELNGKQFEGRALAVTEARPREEKPGGFRPSPGGSGGDRKPFSGGGGYRPPGGGGGGGRKPSGGGGWTDGGGRGGRPDQRPRGPRPMRGHDDE